MNIGLIGYGYWGKFVARSIARVGNLAVVVDPNPTALGEARDTWGPWGTRVASEARVAYEECQAVWIATPTASHYEDVAEALANDCHVMCEKPFVTNSVQAEELCQMAEVANLALMVGHLHLFTDEHLWAKDWRELREVQQSIRLVRRNVRASLSDGSVLWGIGPHDVAAAVDLLGPGAEVAFCSGTQHRVTAQLHFPGGKFADIELDWLAQEKFRLCEIDGASVSGGSVNRKPMEPLLREAYAFRNLCEGYSPKNGPREEAREVTRVLEQMDLTRLGVRRHVSQREEAA